MTEKTVPAKTQKDVPATREEERYLKPPVDIYEKEDKLTVIVDMPGVKQDDVDVRVDDGILTIQGKITHEPPAEDAEYREFKLMNFFRQFELGELIDQEKISAKLTNGVMTLNLPKVEKAQPKQIKINIE